MTVPEPRPTGYTDVVPHDVFTEHRAASVIDVREPYERDDGYIDGSANVPLAQLLYRARGWDKHAALILVCRSGARSAVAARQLAAEGFDNLFNLSGGMTAYVAAGLPVCLR
jgi:sulfur-carrier protein adenylyltransferase/sulfurtransferase